MFLNAMILLIGVIFGVSPEKNSSQSNFVYESEELVVEKLAAHTYRHISYLNTDDFGRVRCNGMVVIDDEKAVIFDTPANATAAQELIDWIQTAVKSTVKMVIPTHFHYDCLGSLEVFHQQGIPSYANKTTIELAKTSNMPVPNHSFDGSLSLDLGTHVVQVEHLGSGHTEDNVIGYYAPDRSLFGGCLIKEVGAGEGNLEDADIGEWPLTMEKIQAKYHQASIIIPGHGKPGGQELLVYTKEMFQNRRNKNR